MSLMELNKLKEGMAKMCAVKFCTASYISLDCLTDMNIWVLMIYNLYPSPAGYIPGLMFQYGRTFSKAAEDCVVTFLKQQEERVTTRTVEVSSDRMLDRHIIQSINRGLHSSLLYSCESSLNSIPELWNVRIRRNYPRPSWWNVRFFAKCMNCLWQNHVLKHKIVN